MGAFFFGIAFVFNLGLNSNFMKNAVQLIVVILFSSLIAACGSNKDLQEDMPAQFNQVYYSSTPEGLSLHIPVSAIQEQRISLEAVYFQGMRSPLVLSEEQPNLYVANFRTGSKDMVMHKDPREEYGNRPPQLPEQSPYEIGKDEALLVFTQNGKQKFYKLTGIIEKQ